MKRLAKTTEEAIEEVLKALVDVRPSEFPGEAVSDFWQEHRLVCQCKWAQAVNKLRSALSRRQLSRKRARISFPSKAERSRKLLSDKARVSKAIRFLHKALEEICISLVEFSLGTPEHVQSGVLNVHLGAKAYRLNPSSSRLLGECGHKVYG
jgi:hypothetical protein